MLQDVLARSLMNRFKEFRREKRPRLTPSRPKGIPILIAIMWISTIVLLVVCLFIFKIFRSRPHRINSYFLRFVLISRPLFFLDIIDTTQAVPVTNMQKSPGITMTPTKPVPLPGEDDVSYERHIKTLQVRLHMSKILFFFYAYIIIIIM